MSDRKIDIEIPSTKSVLAFLFMPQFRLSMPAFAHIGPIFIRTIAIMFVQAGLLRPNHPAIMYGLVKEGAKFKFSDLIGEAWYNLRMGDGITPYQYGMFIGVIMMLCLTVVSSVVFVLNFFVSGAQAQLFNHPSGLDTSTVPDQVGSGIFQVVETSPDFAIDILNKVLRQAAYDTGAPMSKALGGLMEVYNTALLVIASIVVFWAIVSVIVDTARTGQIGGGRHSIVWVPIRFVFSLALMIPLASGFNGGQIITLKIAEWGSNLGTNGWVRYVESITDASLVAPVNAGAATDLLVSLGRIETCRQTFNALSKQATPSIKDKFLIKYRYDLLTGNLDSLKQDRFELFGAKSARQQRIYVGNKRVKNYCGSVTLYNPFFGSSRASASAITTASATSALKNDLYEISRDLKYAHFNAFFKNFLEPAQQVGCGLTHEYNQLDGVAACDSPAGDALYGNDIIPDGALFETAAQNYVTDVELATQTARETLEGYVKSSEFMDELKSQGWAGMGIWYQKIQKVNSALEPALESSSAVTFGAGSLEGAKARKQFLALFRDKDSDKIVEATANTMEKYDEWWTGITEGVSAGVLGEQAETDFNGDLQNASGASGGGVLNSATRKIFKTPFVSGGSLLKSGSSVFFDDSKVYPMAQLSSWGGTMMLTGIAGYAAIAASIVAAENTLAKIGSLGNSGIIFKLMQSPIGDFVGTLLTLMILAGVILKYYIPLIPWIRVTFAVLAWIVSVFEAVIIVPLMALANLSTQGEGLFTQTARNLWVSSLNILMRPILTVLGYVASLLIFNAMVGYVNGTFNATIANTEYGAIAGILGYFFNTVIYVFIIFTLANATFKTIDVMPNTVMRWFGGPQDDSFTDSSIEGFIVAAGQHSSRIAGGLSDKANRLPKGDKGGNNKPGGDKPTTAG